MKNLILQNSIFTTQTGKVLPAEINVATQAVREEGCQGYAYTVNFIAPEGLHYERSAVLYPTIEQTPYLAIENHSQYWCRPFWGNTWAELPLRAQMLLYKTQGGYCCILPVCASEYKTTLNGGDNGLEIVLSTNLSGVKTCENQLSFLQMEGQDAHSLLHAITKTAARLLDNGLKMREERTYPQSLEYFGWCSWDAFQIRVHHQGLLQKVNEFITQGVPVHYAIIDDMWADVPNLNNIPRDTSFDDMVTQMHQSKIRTFEGDPVRFPNGMKQAVADLKKAGIPTVGVWFPTTGYWSGYDKDGATAKELGDNLVQTKQGKWMPAPEKQKAAAYFDTLCGKVKDWGADFVKIDNQGFHTNYREIATYGQSASALQSAIDGATQKHFNGALINCMGMPSECLFHRTDSAVCRCSDDFQPESREWFAKNILQCAYNGLLQGQYLVNDWDMWWTDDEQAVKNSLCRAISGGPVYVSDKLNRTRAKVLKPILLKNGKLLRCDESAKPTADCLLANPTQGNALFKIFNRVGDSAVMAAYNVAANGKPCKGTISAQDCRLAKGKYAWFEYFTQTGGILAEGESLPLTLENNDTFRLYTFVPIIEGFAVMGRSDLYVGCKATQRQGNRFTLVESGPVAVVSERPIGVALLDGSQVKQRQSGGVTFITLPENERKFIII